MKVHRLARLRREATPCSASGLCLLRRPTLAGL
ncbi:hypothetical protein E2C01_070914 [Portunus trituberculatus]|uniref:Uncharacterized protein n=1 Tax=Portunus trituberculatus TaxID=210409 RepID=A0A5B7I6L7_PORTR|nr:hypothetical protein [Portunus trituberculatus]